MVANLSAANKYEASYSDLPEITAVIAGAEMFYLSGFFLTLSPLTIMKVAKHAEENNKVFWSIVGYFLLVLLDLRTTPIVSTSYFLTPPNTIG